MNEFRKKPQKPSPPPKPDYGEIYTSPTYEFISLGDCDKGTRVEIYKPNNPYLGESGKPKTIIYLHGFCLSASQIYLTHLEHLVHQGYYVFYPNYQRGFCTFPKHRYNILELTEELLEEVLTPYPISPQGWLNSAIKSVTQAYDSVGLLTQEVDTYLFGHSLGGLFAMSWQYYTNSPDIPSSLIPKQIIVADPVPDSESNIPPFVQRIIEGVHAFKDKVDIKYTGRSLTVPLAILHGNDDTIVPINDWLNLFDSFIATNEKALYLSSTDEYGAPAMYANHEQATINTSFVYDSVANEVFDGVGTEDNLNWRYIWDALDQVIRKGARADQLKFDMDHWLDKDKTPVQPVTPIQKLLPSPST